MRVLMKKLLTYFFSAIAKRQLKSFGSDLRVNFPCRFTNKTVVGNNCNFNGMHIAGNGNVFVGNNFHSG